jgi:hypothetical protein
MYKRSVAIPIKGSASLSSNNLSISSTAKNILSHAIISRNFVNLVKNFQLFYIFFYLLFLKKTFTDLENNPLNHKQIISKISKDGKSASSNSTDACPTLLQTKFVDLSNRTVLVICTTKAIYVNIKPDCRIFIYFINFSDL